MGTQEPDNTNDKLELDPTEYTVYGTDAIRKNGNKARPTLIDPWTVALLAAHLENGAVKYNADNWRKGFNVRDVIDSIRRHISAIERGGNLDSDDSLTFAPHPHHAMGVIFGAMCILHQYYTPGRGLDNRLFKLPRDRVTLDIDNVLADYDKAMMEQFGVKNLAFVPQEEREAWLSKVTDSFWLNIPVLNGPDMINFQPLAYISARADIPTELTVRWLSDNGFPPAPVYHTKDKASVLNKLHATIHIDDSLHIIRHILDKAPYTKPLLLTHPNNAHLDVGDYRLDSLDLV